MAVDEQNELPEATRREAELQRQLDCLQSQVTELHKTREDTNPELSLEVQSLKEKLNEHSKQLEQSAEKLSQLESENLNLQDKNQVLNTPSNMKYASTREKAKDAQTYDIEDSESKPQPDKEAPEGATKAESPMVAYLEQMLSKRLDTMQCMVERLPGVAPPIRKSNPDSYADNPFTDEITLIEMPRKFSFPSIKAYDDTTSPDDHIAQYRQRMLAVALPKEARDATMCKGFGSTLTGPAMQWYINLPSRSIASFVILSDKFVEEFASSKGLEKTSDGLYEILQHRAEPLRGYIARFNQEKMAIPECSIPTAISSFKREDRTHAQPKAHQGHYIPKNLRVLTRPQGPNTNTRVPIRSPDLRQNHVSSHDLKVQSRSQEPLGSNYDLQIYQESSGSHIAHRASIMIPRSKREPPGSTMTSGSQIRLHGLGEPSGPKCDLRISKRTSGLPHDLRVPDVISGFEREPSGSPTTSRSPYSRKLETSGEGGHFSGPSYNFWVLRLPSGLCVISMSRATPTSVDDLRNFATYPRKSSSLPCSSYLAYEEDKERSYATSLAPTKKQAGRSS
ncbi:hypothetical protein DY000_02007496 [Brassica cretica]|uniref:Retrotransposon gag domain-containing protein n=1 Tax=Brassica cretica TaxID=69181 RepID=A0ABQ7CHU2_BRACR|nr:hypothetical protein DY000_02007496 [Brassica cretica]